MARYYQAMVYDAARDVIVLFGGTQDEVTPLGDLWEYDVGSNVWTQRTFSGGPSARWGMCAGWDDNAETMVIYGGTSNGTVALSDTWTWDGSAWANPTPTHSPGPRMHASSAQTNGSGYGIYHPVGLYFGWDGSAAYNDVWIWSGTDWIECSLAGGSAPPPPVRMNSTSGFSQVYGGLMFCGGRAAPSDSTGMNDRGAVVIATPDFGVTFTADWTVDATAKIATLYSDPTGTPIANSWSTCYLPNTGVKLPPFGPGNAGDAMFNGAGALGAVAYTYGLSSGDAGTVFFDQAPEADQPPAQFGTQAVTPDNFNFYAWGGSDILGANAENFYYWDGNTSTWSILAPASGPTPGPLTPPVSPGISLVYPTTWRTMRFELTEAPDFVVSSAGPGDALNPLSWSLERLDNDSFLTPVAVAQVNATTFDVTVTQVLPSHLIQVECGIVGLVFGGTPTSATVTVQGMTWAPVFYPDGVAAQKLQVTTDLANPPIPISDSSNVGGTLQIAGGDYVNETGDAFVKKMILRLLSTPKGGFFHLPDYGYGVLTAKTFIPPSKLLETKQGIEQAIKNSIPEVSAVQAQITLMPNGLLKVTIAARTRPQGGTIYVSASSVPVLPGYSGGN